MSRQIADLAIDYIKRDIVDLSRNSEAGEELRRLTAGRNWDSERVDSIMDDIDALSEVAGRESSPQDAADKIAKSVYNFNLFDLALRDSRLSGGLAQGPREMRDYIDRYSEIIRSARRGDSDRYRGRDYDRRDRGRDRYRDDRRDRDYGRDYDRRDRDRDYGRDREYSRRPRADEDRYGVNARPEPARPDMSRTSVLRPREEVVRPAPEPQPVEPQIVVEEAIVEYNQHRLAAEWFKPMTSADAGKQPSTVEDFNAVMIDPMVEALVKATTSSSRTPKKNAALVIYEPQIELPENDGAMDMLTIVEALGDRHNPKSAYLLNLRRDCPYRVTDGGEPDLTPPEVITHSSNLWLLSALFDDVDDSIARAYTLAVTKRVNKLIKWYISPECEIDSYWLDANSFSKMLVSSGALAWAKIWDDLAPVIRQQCLSMTTDVKQVPVEGEEARTERSMVPHTNMRALVLPLHSANAPLSLKYPHQLNLLSERNCPKLHTLVKMAFNDDRSVINLIYFSNGDKLEVVYKDDEYYVTIAD